MGRRRRRERRNRAAFFTPSVSFTLVIRIRLASSIEIAGLLAVGVTGAHVAPLPAGAGQMVRR
jgi:hypothetical protein